MIVRAFRRRLCLAVALLAGLGTGRAGAAEWKVLAPRDGFRAAGGEAWLVVAGPTAPRVALDGKVVPVPPAVGRGVFHVRLAGLRSGGSRLEVGDGPGAVRRTVSGGGGAAAGFHAAPAKACGSCHREGPAGCRDCHRWKGASHKPIREGRCDSCHGRGGPLVGEVAALCGGCHPGGRGGRHGKLRHPLSAPQDPARPGRPLDCVSCHDPHAPASLGRLSPEAQRAWCKGCHRR